jgi:uncharacterized protein (DUF433 family)
MPAAVDIGSLIERDPLKEGRPYIAGTSVTVRCIAAWSNHGETPDEIAAGYPHLTLAQIFAALAYYHANREEIDQDLAAEEATEVRYLREQGISTPQ